ncbi:MAG: type IV pilus twitching motility protein PilT [Myxococcota bacterium]|nr:type IV pilus twitching motility protein PilT [Myxococcota bacterium]
MTLTDICRAAVSAGASDIHIKAGSRPIMRVDGEMVPIPETTALVSERVGKMAWNIMAPAQRDRFKTDLDLDMSWNLEGLGRFRVNVFRQRQSIAMVLRVIPSAVKSLDDLRMPEVLKTIAGQPRGLVLVTGITGSGKSTTLAAMIEEINRTRANHIVTIEDPIEFVFQDKKSVVNQREVGVDTLSFSNALRAALRQDPDVIFVGELRDRETVEIALNAAETGHLVLSTLHTIDAAETINRIIGFFDPHHHTQVRAQLASVLQATLSQRLIQTTMGGRVAAVEVMRNTGVITDCMMDPARTKEIPDLMARNHTVYGTQTFDQAVYSLLQDGVIDKEQALRAVNNPDDLELRIQGIHSAAL